MEDAYVIGIRIALENGVSTGIAAIAAELSHLDGAIARTTAQLLTLERVASDVGKSTMAKAEFGPGKSKNSRAADPVIDPPPESSPAPYRPPVRSTPSEMTEPPVPTSDSGHVSLQPASSPIAAGMPQPHQSPRVTLPPAAPDALRPPATSLPTAPVSRFNPASRDQPAPPAREASANLYETSAKRLAPGPLASSEARVVLDRSVSQAPPSSKDFGGGGNHVATPAAPQYATHSTSSSVQPIPTSIAPPARTPPGSGLHGDVYLDGARLGRWMSDQLAREANRPAAGSTAFDPRLGLAWPGALQGR